MKKENMTITNHRRIARNIYEMELEGKLVQETAGPGQFLHILPPASDSMLLRRPISICKTDKKTSRLTIIYRAEGKGTNQLAFAPEESRLDVMGPLGNGFPAENVSPGEHVLLTGGGIGVPPLYDTACDLREKGIELTTVLGFSDKETVFYEERFRELGDVYVSTEDGSYGTAGFVTDVIASEKLSFDRIFACGPVPMLKALEDAYPNARGSISLEERMGCGLGVCLACVCRSREDSDGTDYRKICSDGPVFSWGEVLL
ncbi:dihydroorotate dehydrogenase electron transfer subunit [Salibacterium halotolerans]|uniref:Dihydroorotate dehydrogenase B (NAD(+)), electron transfer subunit n=1 Tax=Salibacterium halotolerans TaxID=1884432 RepID=A0A1I5M7P7_9BACI|nr:dihydroorotate dehydrogenase electron transfer subunit [Salibacterium halotolerans]SFP05550.1 dihydroorotate dehydrogenase electron transfer subunit [Salibacterium halotolerans]